MSFAGRKGIHLVIDKIGNDPLAALFAEELGAVIELDKSRLAEVMAVLAKHKLSDIAHLIGNTTDEGVLEISHNGQSIYSQSITTLNRAWSELTYRMQAERDNPDCAKEEYDALLEPNKGLIVEPTFDPETTFNIGSDARPRMAILREQGINGQNEMAFAFDRAGFEAVDLHMTDLLAVAHSSTASLDSSPAAASPTATYSAPVPAGQIRPLQRAAQGTIPTILPAPRQLHPRRLQRLPDDLPTQGHHPRSRTLAPLSPQPLRAIRSPLRQRRNPRINQHTPTRHGRQPPASPSPTARPGRLLRHRQLREMPHRQSNSHALHRPQRRTHRNLSGQPQRITNGRYRIYHSGRTRHHHDAPPRTLLSLRPDVLPPRRPLHRRSRALAENVPERPHFYFQLKAIRLKNG